MLKRNFAGNWISVCLIMMLTMLSPAFAADKENLATPWDNLNAKKLKLKSTSVMVVDSHGNPVYTKDSNTPMPIASITKLMSAMVILDKKLPLDEKITITKDDRDTLRNTGSRLNYGATLTRREMLQLALMSSENRAASALGRTYPGGTAAIVRDMNKKAKALGMTSAIFADPVGLQAENVASAKDLVKMTAAAEKYDLIHKFTTSTELTVYPYRKKGPLKYVNTNRLVKNKNWDIEVSKTGYINEAGRCLVMKTEIAGEPMVIVLLNSYGKLTPFGDANRFKKWLEQG
jgi:D-alanyl-D-alanine endopeptidase (penicillin-binding protein 7)